MRRRQWIALAVFVVLLLVWPLTYYYTSFGIDSERREGQRFFGRYYRVRWPGNGVMMVGYIDEHHRDRGKPAELFDLGGVFLRPAKAPTAVSMWNWLGFWWVAFERSKGDDDHAVPGADRARMVGVPHWLFVVGAGWVVMRGMRRMAPPVPSPRRGES